eukprot:6202346-Alexandrium_andersonii.AAC.1
MSKNQERWVTRDQLVNRYHSEVVADAVIAGLSADEKRPNPAAPKCVDANQFYAASLTYALHPTHTHCIARASVQTALGASATCAFA